jgi:hypothetical protein
MNWQSMAPVIFEGVQYGQKDLEFPKFIGLPRRTRVPLELAIAGAERAHRPASGGGVADPSRPSGHRLVDRYLAYIAASQGEFGVCKHVCVRHQYRVVQRAQRRVLGQRPTGRHARHGFSRHLPCGRGLFAVRTVEEAAAAID